MTNVDFFHTVLCTITDVRKNKTCPGIVLVIHLQVCDYFQYQHIRMSYLCQVCGGSGMYPSSIVFEVGAHLGCDSILLINIYYYIVTCFAVFL